jgi:opacity protein-like surface antigen
MKKLLSVVLVLVLTMSVALTASAVDMSAGAAVPVAEGGITMPSIGEAFNALSDFLKLEPIMVFVNGFHEAMGGFYVQFDSWLRAIGVVVYGILGGVFAG